MAIWRSLLWAATLSAMSMQALAMPTKSYGHDPSRLPKEHAQTLVNNYNTIWSTGKFDLLNITVAPNIIYYQDRLPSGQGNGSLEFPIANTTGFITLVEQARLGWRSYGFDILYSFSSEDRIVARWTLIAVSNGTGVGSQRLLSAGTQIAFNGTDTYHVNCDGLIDEVASTQDYISDYHQLRIPLGTV